jgi:hypothetical protein
MAKHFVELNILVEVDDGAYWPAVTHEAYKVVRSLSSCDEDEHTPGVCSCQSAGDDPGLLALSHLMYAYWNVPGASVISWELHQGESLVPEDTVDSEALNEAARELHSRRKRFETAMIAVDRALSET